MTRTDNIWGYVSRRVDIVDQRPVVVDIPVSDRKRFTCEVVTTGITGATDDASPRARPSMMRYSGGLLGVGAKDLKAGWRVRLNRWVEGRFFNVDYELLANPREMQKGAIDLGFEVPVLPVSLLYPKVAQLRSQDAAVLILALPVALWTERETHASTGTYEQLAGEAPPEYAEELSDNLNRSLMVGTMRYRVTSSFTDLTGPRVRFDARLTHG